MATRKVWFHSKATVKSLAFEFLDTDGNAAVIPSASITYVLINMRAIGEETDLRAYNACHVQWKGSSIDENTNHLTGIRSNITKVALNDFYELEASVKWDDFGNAYATRPENVFIILTKNDEKEASKIVSREEEKFSFDKLVLDDARLYKIEQEAMEPEYAKYYDTNVIYDKENDIWTIVNSLKPEYRANINISIEWDDNNNVNEARPSAVTVRYKYSQNGENENLKELEISEADGWQGILEVGRDDDGNVIPFVISESWLEDGEQQKKYAVFYNGTTSESDGGYTVTSEDGSTVTILNRFGLKPKVSVNFKHTLEGENGNAPEKYLIIIENADTKEMVVVPVDKDGVRIEGLESGMYIIKSAQNPKYTIVDMQIEKSDTGVSIEPANGGYVLAIPEDILDGTEVSINIITKLFSENEFYGSSYTKINLFNPTIQH